MRGPFPPRARLEGSPAARLELPAPRWTGFGAGRSSDCTLEESALAGVKKNAAREGRTIIFLDESGLSERPHRCRTWAPRGKTPILQYHFRWQTLSAIAGVTWWNFYVQLHRGTIRSPQVVGFLRHLCRHVKGKLLIIWDRLQQHRSRIVKDFLVTQKGKVEVDYLPAYAPELNPVEYLWGYWKKHQLANLCAKDLDQLSSHARAALRRMRPRRSSLIAAFWKQAELPF
jgi:transposase